MGSLSRAYEVTRRGEGGRERKIRDLKLCFSDYGVLGSELI